MSAERQTIVQALKYRCVTKGVIRKSEKLYGLTPTEEAHIARFLADWQEDIVLAVGLHFDKLGARHIQMLVDCGRIRPEQLQDAFENFLSCWSHLKEDVRNWECWLPVRRKLQELSVVKDEYGEWYLFPKLQVLMLRHEGEQPCIRFPGPFTSTSF